MLNKTSAEFIHNTLGNYRILPSGAAYCAGIIPDQGFEVVRAELQGWIPLEQAYAFIEQHLKSLGRPVQAFCGIELRVPAPLTMESWSSFNVPYLAQLRNWGLVFSDYSGVCRSNIALDLYPPSVTSMCAFSYTIPTDAPGPTFLLSGQADISGDGKVIADGDTGPAAMQTRTRFTIEAVSETLTKLGFSWQDTTRAALFHTHDIPELWGPTLLGKIGEPIRRGVLVYRARPPIAGGEVELEARAVRKELVVASR
ncbi:2-amino-5-chloromuconate deaminase [compost metagenome]